jgi:glycyl-tRNA synthetase
MNTDLMAKITSLCKRRGFIFQSSEIYGGLKSCYDYGPLGVELKRNVAKAWWSDLVTTRDNVVGIDTSIMMHPEVWRTSGHVANFSDPLVDCLDCKERFRADKAPKIPVGTPVTFKNPLKKATPAELQGNVSEAGYVCPNCGSPRLSDERLFNGMFKTTMGPVDPLSELTEEIFKNPGLSKEELRDKIMQASLQNVVYLRPETAQGMFVQFLNVLQTTSLKVPFGIAQQGKSFRNEIVTEHFTFRSCEFEQMEMEFFCEPGSQVEWLDYWTKERMGWYQRLASRPENFRLRQHDANELAHYSDNCYDIEYLYPWGWDELEGIASRTDYDLKKHAAASGVKLSYFDPNKADPQTGKTGYRYVPYVIEPAAGLTRIVLCLLLDAYREETLSQGSDSESRERVYLKLAPELAPYKAAILPLVKKDGQPEIALKLTQEMREAGFNVSFDEQQSIGKRYAKNDEIGTPFCFTIDNQTLTEGLVTVRNRDTGLQDRIALSQSLSYLQDQLRRSNKGALS